MRSWKPLGLVPLQHDPKQLVARHVEGGSGEDGRQVSLSLPYARFAAPRAEPPHPALLARGGSIASTALHFGIVALLIPVGRTVESSFFEQHMVYLIPLERPAPVEAEIESPSGTGPSSVPTGAGAKTLGAPVPAAAAAVNKPTKEPTAREPTAKRATPGDVTPDVSFAPTLLVTRNQLLRTETPAPIRNAAPLTEIAVGNAVGNAVERDPASAAPEFPARLLATGVSGEVIARFIVDTLGIADVTSYTVVRSTRAEFSDAVVRALPRMRFRPANQRGRLVRQWVEQTFHFRVQRRPE